MTKTKINKSRVVFKGAVAGVSLVLCMTFFPIKAVSNLITNAAVSADMITLDASKAETQVKKGDHYLVPTAKFNNVDIAAANVEIRYKGSKQVLALSEGPTSVAGVCGVFIPDRVGKYVITYTAQKEGKTYSYDFEFECVLAEAFFEFVDNSENIIPSIYDISVLEKQSVAAKDLILPTPKVYQEKDNEIAVQYFKKEESVPNEVKNYVKIDLVTATSNQVRIQSKTENEKTSFYLAGADLTAKNESGKYKNLGVYKIVYTYYEDGKFVAQTTKSFEVKENYYETNKEESNFTLNASFITSSPNSAVTGVEIELPKVKGATSATDSPASEEVAVYYTISVAHKEDGVWKDRTAECLNQENQNKFTAFKDGDYKISYLVKDFFGHTAKTESTTFYINNVKDTKAPEVYIYDGNADYSFVKKDGVATDDYLSAEHKLKSKTVNRNIIVYAIGAKDNVQNQNMKLTRQIRDASATIRIETSEYNDKNLIFNLASSKDDAATEPLVQLIKDNYYLQIEMKQDGITVSSSLDEIKTWLLNHNYLIVTNDEGKKNEQGYAYINYDYSFSQQKYSVYYLAEDDAGNKNTKEYFSIDVTNTNNYADSEVPTIKFPTSLQSTYLPKESFTFKAPIASDETDSAIEMHFAYRFLKADNNPLKEGESLSFYMNDISSKKVSSGAWYGGAEGEKTSRGWTILESMKDDEDFKIDISKDGVGASYIEIFAYAMDDYGNIGVFSKKINIAEQDDNESPELYKVVNDNTGTSFDANKEITLPTLYYSDDHVEYMKAEVVVYYFDSETNSNKYLQSSDMKTSFDTNSGIYIVEAGTFTASRAGDYHVSIIARDAGNRSIATFFDYTVTSSAIIEDPVIENINSQTVELKIGEEYYLPSPTVSVSAGEKDRFYGLSESDDAKTAEYYTTEITSAENNNYELSKFYFKANSKGLYTLIYRVNLIKYNIDDLASTATAGKLLIDENGSLCYYKDGVADANKYYLYVTTNAAGDIIVAGNTKRNREGTALDTVPSFLTAYSIESDPQTFKVAEMDAPIITINDDHYNSSTSIEGEAGNQRIEILPLAAKVNGDGKVDEAKSKIDISVTKGTGTTTLATIYCDKFSVTNTDSVKYENGKLWLYLKYDGTYTIKYSAQAVNYVGESVGDATTKSYTIEHGDIITPTIKVEDGFINKKADEFGLNDELILNIEKLTLWDNDTDVQKLKENIEIVVKNVDTKTEIKRENNEGKTYNYILKTAGEYEISIKTTDAAGWPVTKTVTIKVASKQISNIPVTQIVGTILIVVSVVILAGVITYFVVSKVKMDKKMKSKKK